VLGPSTEQNKAPITSNDHADQTPLNTRVGGVTFELLSRIQARNKPRKYHGLKNQELLYKAKLCTHVSMECKDCFIHVAKEMLMTLVS